MNMLWIQIPTMVLTYFLLGYTANYIRYKVEGYSYDADYSWLFVLAWPLILTAIIVLGPIVFVCVNIKHTPRKFNKAMDIMFNFIKTKVMSLFNKIPLDSIENKLRKRNG